MLEKIALEEIVEVAKEAGEAIMEIYQKDFDVEYKDDSSPLTEADKRAHAIIASRLGEMYPDIPILSEEGKSIPYHERKEWRSYWCVDPIDGTKEFIKKNDEFTVNIALIQEGEPILGVVYAPAVDELYYAKKGSGAFLNGKPLPLERKKEKNVLKVVASKSHLSEETQAFIDALDADEIEQVSRGSSLKLCMVASGEADIYPRLAPTMEWDTAAADAIVRESGKMTYIFDEEKPLQYNKENLLNPWFVVKRRKCNERYSFSRG